MDAEKKKILVVDDEDTVRESLELILSRFYDVQSADNGERALSQLIELRQAEKQKLPDLVLLDVMMPGMDGISLLQKIKSDFPAIPVIMLTASTSVKSAVSAMKFGAVDYLNKPYDVDELIKLINNSFSQGGLDFFSAKHVRTGLKEVPGDFGSLVGKHPLMKSLYEKIEQLAAKDTSILITGESGTGKELFAKEIHQRSARKEKPFVIVDCASLSGDSAEEELFGTEQGRQGLIEKAHGGTLFIDEVAELTLTLQAKILRFLQDRAFVRVGGSTSVIADVRLIVSSNQDLDEKIREEKFRKDLYYRINVATLEIPSLREHTEDIPELVNYFQERFSPLYGESKKVIKEDVFEIFRNYSWPGNVRELENIVESLLALCVKDEIAVVDLPSRILFPQATKDKSDDILSGFSSFEEAEQAFERQMILKALQKADYVQTKAADILGISRRILKYKMDKLGILEQSENPVLGSQAPGITAPK